MSNPTRSDVPDREIMDALTDGSSVRGVADLPLRPWGKQRLFAELCTGAQEARKKP